MLLGIETESIGKSKSFKNLELISSLIGVVTGLYWALQLKLIIENKII
jgi:hypothetical protein